MQAIVTRGSPQCVSPTIGMAAITQRRLIQLDMKGQNQVIQLDDDAYLEAIIRRFD